jgi:hypothetical protein
MDAGPDRQPNGPQQGERGVGVLAVQPKERQRMLFGKVPVHQTTANSV